MERNTEMKKKHFRTKGLSSILLFCFAISLFNSCNVEDLCENVNCLNNGECIDGTCVCPDGFTGVNCEIEDLCITQSVACLNDGVCEDGTCECPLGFTGVNCELLDLTEIQAILDAGFYTPMDLINAGVAEDDLLGKSYADGFIFYLDIVNDFPGFEGLVSASSDQGLVPWGCWQIDVPELGNSGSTNNEVPGTGLGDGFSNTELIVDNCPGSMIAAKVCREVSEDWFLPSRAELNLIYTKLHLNGIGEFGDDYYWSSTEGDSSNPGVVAWGQEFSTGNRTMLEKNKDHSVRAVRSF